MKWLCSHKNEAGIAAVSYTHLVIGYVAFSPVDVQGEDLQWVGMAPLAVDEKYRGQGLSLIHICLRALARNDFSQALAIRPDMPEVFNYLGIYLTQAGNFDAAYEAVSYTHLGESSVNVFCLLQKW